MTRSALSAAATAAALLTGTVVGAFAGAGPAAAGSPRSWPSASSVAAPFVPAADVSGRVVVVGTGGLSWSDVSRDETPALWSLLRDGATATVTVRSVRTNTCPVDGWLSLSAGQRAGDVDVLDPGGGNDNKPPCKALAPAPVDTPGNSTGNSTGNSAGSSTGRAARWDTYLQAARDKDFGAKLGLLADQVSAAGGCVQAVGPGAALGAAGSDGGVPRFAPFDPASLSSSLTGCALTLVDVGSMRDPSDVDPMDQVRPSASRAEQVARIDARVGAVLAAAPKDADILVASLSDAGETERLRLVAMRGPHFGPGSLRSLSTRQPGLIQSADLTATILSLLHLGAPEAVSGRPLQVVPAEDTSEAGARDRLQGLVDDDLASHEVHALVPPFFQGWVYTQIAIYAFVAVVWRRRWGSERTRLRLLRIVQKAAIIAATVPVSTFLANLLPWWRLSVPLVAITVSVAIFVGALSAFALLGPWRRALLGPLTAVATATMVVLAADVMTGSRLQVSSLMGLQPVVGGRFYGMGNVTFALFATATLLLCIAAADYFLTRGRRGMATAAVALIGLTGVVVDASPSWGSDFGGPPALLPGLAFLVLAVLGIRLTWRKALLVGAGTVAFLVAVGLLDWRRPAESRSHLGGFVQAVIDGGAFDIIVRKGAQNLSILTSSILTLLVPLGLGFVIYILARPTAWGSQALQRSYDRAPILRPGLTALLITLIIGFAMNDSGTAIPAVAATLAIPLVIAVSVRTLLDEAAQDQSARAERRPDQAGPDQPPSAQARPGYHPPGETGPGDSATSATPTSR